MILASPERGSFVTWIDARIIVNRHLPVALAPHPWQLHTALTMEAPCWGWHGGFAAHTGWDFHTETWWKDGSVSWTETRLCADCKNTLEMHTVHERSSNYIWMYQLKGIRRDSSCWRCFVGRQGLGVMLRWSGQPLSKPVCLCSASICQW